MPIIGSRSASANAFAVASDERRIGVATRQLVALARAAIARGCSAWTLEVRATSHGAQRYRAEILDGFHCEIADQAHPSAGPLVQLAHAKALREEWVSASDIRPVYLRQPDAQINWATRASSKGPAR